MTHPHKSVLEESERVAIASSADDGRRPEPRGDVERGEDPDDALFAAGKRADLVCLNLGDLKSCDLPIAESSAVRCGSLKPAIYGVPADPFHSSDGGLAHTLDAERGDFVERRPTMLQAVVSRVGGRAEGLSAGAAAIAATLAGLGRVEAVSDDVGSLRTSGAAGCLHFGPL